MGSLKLPGLRAPITIDPVVAKAHVLRPETAVSSESIQQQLNTRRSEQIDRARQLRLTRPTPLGPLKLDVQGFLSDLAGKLTDAEGFVAHIQYPDPKNPGGYLQDSRSGGWAIDPADPGQLAWSTSCPMHVASVSKLVTAVAMTRAFLYYQISPDTAIGGYLPYFWTQGPNIGNVTFRQLLTHKSGIDSMAMDYMSMQTQVDNGVDANKIGQQVYANMNFSLCRMLLASILMLVVTYEPNPVPETPPGFQE